ncbi:MAG: hypothetical protein ACK4Z6_00810 [Candidatus Methylomirabilales bacterium]
MRSIVSAEEDYLATKRYGSRILTTEEIAQGFDPIPLFAEGEEIYDTLVFIFDERRRYGTEVLHRRRSQPPPPPPQSPDGPVDGEAAGAS